MHTIEIVQISRMNSLELLIIVVISRGVKISVCDVNINS